MSANDSITEQFNQYVTGTFSLSPARLAFNAPPLDFNHVRQTAPCRRSAAAIRPHLPNTKGFSEEKLYDTYAAYVERYGSTQARNALRDGHQVIVGLRIETNTRANKGRGLYDDRLAIIWQEIPSNSQQRVQPGCLPRGQHGRQSSPHNAHQPHRQPGGRIVNQAVAKHGIDFTANTEPSAYYEQPTTHLKQIKSKKTGKMIQVRVVDKMIDPDGKEVISHPKKKWQGGDVNKDGRLDLGMLVPGTYSFFQGDNFHGKAALRPLGQQIVYRDVNHDGSFTSNDIWHTDKGDVVIETGNFGILFHKGQPSQTFSAGCQTLPPNEHARFFRTLRKQHEYYYVLVTLK